MKTNEEADSTIPQWRLAVAAHQEPDLRKSLWQVCNSLIPYLALWGLMIASLQVSYWLTLALAPLAAGFLMRIFIIFHDCGHGSFFRSRRANRFMEFITGVLTFTPYGQWRSQHARHHATSADLDHRGTGDIWMLTVQEYLEASRWKRFAYRLARNPFVLFGLAPLYVFLISQRLPSRSVGKRERRGVHWTNAALLGLILVATLTIGFKAYVLIQLPVILIAAVIGIWLFYIQHQFEGVYWQRKEEWDFAEAALRGSSYYDLPRILQWFSGNIGFHHIHHLSPSIPNYNMERCHRENPMFHSVKSVTLRSSLKSFTFRLWDEQLQRLVGYGRLRAVRRKASA